MEIQVIVKLFAVYREVYGTEEITMTLPAGSTVGSVLAATIVSYPQLAAWKDLTKFGVNLNFADADTILADGDEVVLIPPVSGG